MCRQICESPVFFGCWNAAQHKLEEHISKEVFYKTLPWVLLVLAANSGGKLGGGVQDPACAVGAGHTASVCVVSGEPAPSSPAAARHAREKSAGSHQLLRGERKYPQPEALRASGGTKLAQVAQPP